LVYRFAALNFPTQSTEFNICLNLRGLQQRGNDFGGLPLHCRIAVKIMRGNISIYSPFILCLFQYWRVFVGF